MKRIGLSVAILFLICASLLSQSPNKFNYQAVVRGTDGNILADQQISLRLTINQGRLNGNTVYTEIHNPVTNDFGIVSLQIGTGSTSDDFHSVNWSYHNGLWLKLEVDLNGGSNFKDMGGMQLISVPYALFSNEAGSAPVVLKSMSNSERQMLESPPVGMMILNTTSGKINVKKDDGWYEFDGEKIAESFMCGQNLVDPRDQQSYKTIMIGDRCWMAENLNSGQMINGAVEMTNNDVIEKYCYENSEAHCDTYGGLYQWDEMMQYSKTESSQGICPDGWHIPSDAEVQELEVALGMDPATAALNNVWRGSNQGTLMAPGGDSGYDALYSGRRVTGGLYSALNDYEYLYTSTEYGTDAYRRCLRFNDPRIGRYNTFPKTYGMSVRCVKN